MCGLVGFCDYSKSSNESILKSMLKMISHRGPDDEGIHFYKESNCNIALGHRRLSIIDLSFDGHQPMSYDNLDILFNGEIYNYKDIKNELLKYNYSFNSSSDTEVILKAFHKWGVKFLDKLNGMFAISIYDKKSQKIYLFRDRVGIKPMHWFFNGDSFIYGSELKSFYKYPNFKKELNKNAIVEYFHKGYIAQDRTIFKNCHKLKKAHYLEYDIKKKDIKITKYWDVDITNEISDEKYALSKLDMLINNSVKLRLIADVNVGSFLSGGIDSSLVTAIAQKNYTKKIKTFTIGFNNKKYDESIYAKDVAKYLNTEHYDYFVTQDDFKDIIKDIALILDEPMADSSIIPTTILSNFTKQKVKVSLSADGGDELFGGYISYQNALNLHSKKNLTKLLKPIFLLKLKNRKYNRLKSLVDAKTILDFHTFYSAKFTNSDLTQMFKFKLQNSNDNNNYSGIDKLLYKDFNNTLPEQLLLKVDRATMFASLEGRVPLLDHNIVEFVYKLDSKFRTNKDLLKKLAYSYIPQKLLDRPKKGFRVPLEELLKYSDYKRFFQKEFIIKQNLFNFEYIKYLDNSFRKNSYNSSQIWTYLIFQIWYEYWEIGKR